MFAARRGDVGRHIERPNVAYGAIKIVYIEIYYHLCRVEFRRFFGKI
jgi:hypothetical protein